jgi:hypothetical protein
VNRCWTEVIPGVVFDRQLPDGVIVVSARYLHGVLPGPQVGSWVVCFCEI